MKYTISINQKAAVDLKLDVDMIDLAIFDMLKDFSGSTACKKMQDNNRNYFSVPYRKVLDELPLLPITKPDGVYRRFKKLEAAGVLEMHPDNAKLSMVWFSWGRNYDKMISSYTPGLKTEGSEIKQDTPGLKTDPPSDLKPTHNNTFSFSSSSYNCTADFQNDWQIRETFISVRRIPEAKYETYLNAFSKEIAATGETHNNRPQLVKHFLNWSESRYRIENPPVKPSTPQNKFTPAAAQEPRGAAYQPFPADY